MTGVKPVQKDKKTPRVLLLWNHHEDAVQAAEVTETVVPPGDFDQAESPPATAVSDEIQFIRARRAPPGGSRGEALVAEVSESLRQAGFDVVAFDLEDDPGRVHDAITVVRPAFVFNLVDEFYGDNTQHAAIAAYMDLLGAVYTGSDPMCLTSCQDRVRTHLLLQHAGIPVPAFAVIRDVNVIPETDGMRFPVIITQAFDDLYDEEGLERPIADRAGLVERSNLLFGEFDLPFLIEEYLECRRLHTVVIGDRVLEVLPLIELDEDPEAVVPWRLARLDYDTADRVRQLARRAFRVMGCRDLAQIDFHFDVDGAPYVVDVRPVVELGVGSVFHGAAEHTERGHGGCIAQIARLAEKRAPADPSTGEATAQPTSPATGVKAATDVPGATRPEDADAAQTPRAEPAPKGADGESDQEATQNAVEPDSGTTDETPGA